MCDQEAITVEHAPPKCIFPEIKDTPDERDYRKNLITVPSCNEHNTAKSHDDEYLLFILAASITSSNIGLTQFLTKVKRSAERKPALASKMASNSTPVQIFHEDKKQWEDAAGIVVEGARIDATLGKCARALYFYETSRKFFGTVRVITPFTMYSDPSFNNSIASAVATADSFFSSYPLRGENHDVFWYKFEEGEVTATMLLCFYGSTKILVRFDKR
ncbi:MAG: hypothetical protein WAO71_03645 [Gallionella sp.]